MNTKRTPFSCLVILLVFLPALVYSQNQEDHFISYGKFNGKIFSNFHFDLLSEEHESAFAVERAYFGYDYWLSENFSVKLKLDIGSPNQESSYDILKRYAYFKNAALIYKKNNLTLSFGLIDLYQFKVQEKFWGHRYIYKSFQDEHKFGNSADLGASIQYKLNNFITADYSLVNGEGYNQLQTDNSYKSAIGLTIKPIKAITVRLYADYIEHEEIQSTWSAFLGYQLNEILTFGFEYNYQLNNKFVKDYNLSGLSTYASYQIFEKWELFARYDKLWSNTLKDDPYQWNINKDGSAIIAGIQYSPIKNINVAANYQDWYPYAQNIDNQSYFYLNLEFQF